MYKTFISRLLYVTSDLAEKRKFDYAGPLKKNVIRVQRIQTGNGGATVNRAWHEIDVLKTNFYEPSLVLHPMCGPGKWANLFIRRYPNGRYLGIDVNPLSAQFAMTETKNQQRCKFITKNIIDDNLQDYEHDVVVWTFESLNFFPWDIAKRLLIDSISSSRVKLCLVSLRDHEFSRFKQRKFRISFDAANPIALGSALVFQLRRPMSDCLGFEDSVLCVSRKGFTNANCPVWLHSDSEVESALAYHGFKLNSENKFFRSKVQLWVRNEC